MLSLFLFGSFFIFGLFNFKRKNMNYDDFLEKESVILEKLIKKEYEKFSKALNLIKYHNYESEDIFKRSCNDLQKSSIFYLRNYVNDKFFNENSIDINGIITTHIANSVNVYLQGIISQKDIQFYTLCHQYISDNLPES